MTPINTASLLNQRPCLLHHGNSNRSRNHRCSVSICLINPSHRTPYPMLFWLHPSKLAKKDSDEDRLAVHLLKKQETGLRVGPSFQAKTRSYVCMHVYIYVCMFPKTGDMYVTLLRARKELGFSVVVQFHFAITGRERQEGGGKKGTVPHKARPIYLLSKAATGIDLR